MVEVLQDIMQEIEDVIDKVKDEELQAVMEIGRASCRERV